MKNKLIQKTITTGGHYGDLDLMGHDRNAGTGLLINLKAGEVAEFGDIKTRNLFNPIVIIGAGTVKAHSVDNQCFGGDGIQARSSNICIKYANVENVTPTRPYKVCERMGGESIEECLARNNEQVFDSGLLEWVRHPAYKNEIIPSCHVDALIQLYATKPDGYTLDPSGIITNIRIPNVRARINDSKVQLVMGSESNDYSDIRIGTETFDVEMPYRMPVVFNTLNNSKIGCDHAKIHSGSMVKIKEVKPRPSHIPQNKKRTFGNDIKGFLPGCIIEDCQQDIPEITPMNRILYNREMFFRSVRDSLFNGALDQGQVDGIEAILSYWEENHPDKPIEYVAYSLANAYHEVDKTMQPIREYGSYSYFMRRYDISGENPKLAKQLGNIYKGDGAKFCGQGITMCTGRDNYERQGKKHGVDLTEDPGLIMSDLMLSVKIMVEAMLDGDFTGRSLSDCLGEKGFDPIAARRIINGYAKPEVVNGRMQGKPIAKKIARHYKKFLTALHKSHIDAVSHEPEVKEVVQSRTIVGGGISAAGVVTSIPVISDLVGQAQKATKKIADSSKDAADNVTEVVENAGVIARTLGLDNIEYTSLLFWSLITCLIVIAVGIGLVIYARWDDVITGKNPFKK